jgi:hypothetical protein
VLSTHPSYLLGLLQQVLQVEQDGLIRVASVHKCGRHASFPAPPSTTDAAQEQAGSPCQKPVLAGTEHKNNHESYSFPSASSELLPMDVVLNLLWHVPIHNVLDVGKI